LALTNLTNLEPMLGVGFRYGYPIAGEVNIQVFKPGCNTDAGAICLGKTITDSSILFASIPSTSGGLPNGGNVAMEYAIPLSYFTQGYYVDDEHNVVEFAPLEGVCQPAQLLLAEVQALNYSVVGGSQDYGPNELGVQTVLAAPQVLGPQCTPTTTGTNCGEYFTVSQDGETYLAIRSSDGELFACPNSMGELQSLCPTSSEKRSVDMETTELRNLLIEMRQEIAELREEVRSIKK